MSGEDSDSEDYPLDEGRLLQFIDASEHLNEGNNREYQEELLDENSWLSNSSKTGTETGSSVDAGIGDGGALQFAPRTKVKITHHTNIMGAQVYGAINKVLWGTYNDEEACLLVVRFRFDSRSGLLRLRRARVALCFNNHPRSRIQDPNRNEPVVAIYSPKRIFGIISEVTHEPVWNISLQCSISAGPASITPGVSTGKTKTYATQDYLKIEGRDEPERDKDKSNKVIFEVTENRTLDEGVPKELFFGVVVTCDGETQAEVSTNINDMWAWPWTKDDPIILKPGSKYGHEQSSIPTKFEELSDRNWKLLVPYEEERVNVVQGNTGGALLGSSTN